MFRKLGIGLILVMGFFGVFGQEDSATTHINELQNLIGQAEKIRFADSVRKALLSEQINLLSASDAKKKAELTAEIKRLEGQDSIRHARLAEKALQIKQNATTFPVVLKGDTLFTIYAKSGASGPELRAKNISGRLEKLLKDDFLIIDSIKTAESDYTTDIVYQGLVIMGVTDLDAMVFGKTREQLAGEYAITTRLALNKAREGMSIIRIITRIGLVLLIIAGVWLVISMLIRLNAKGETIITKNKDKWLRSLSYRDYTFLTAEQELNLVLFVLKAFRWILIILVVYLVIPLVFSVFPFTRGWADTLFNLIWSPFKGILRGIWNYIPNLFSIIVIVVVMRYFIRLVRYIFSEIESEKLVLSGFHSDWAMPTFSIVRFLLLAFMFVLIFPYMPGSDSNIFRGVSIFVGVLFSLGSSSSISNMIAGIVITYMRPFKIGDKIKLGDMTGEVIEKTLLVTRLRTVNHEEITIPNSSILTGNTINYSTNSHNQGLVIHTTITIGYDAPWRDVHQAMIEAAVLIPEVQENPQPFVLQTSLDDYYVSYQINAHVKDIKRLPAIYSELHQNIQDVFNRKGIEIMSPHYRAMRDGGTTTIPVEYQQKGEA